MNTNGLEIAIIGMAGRFPGAPDLEAFWQNLIQGVESIVTYSDEALQQQGVAPALLSHPDYVKAGAALDGIEWFDAEFFGISPKEAEILDPQQRLFLECAWQAMERAGYDSTQYSGSVAVYAGAAMNSYLLNLYTNQSIRNSVSPYQVFLASDKDFLTTRVSYKLNLNGPSVDIQTACSTSLVAIHIACQSLLSGECDLALAGGVAVSQPVGYLYQAGGIYSPDGHCRAFDAAAAGTVSGSGLGVVVLKRLDDALRDGDHICAVIKGSAINNDGAQKVSYTAPSVEAQASVIRAAHLMAEVTPDSISYIEAHGTGTALGDPIELAALHQVFQSQTERQQFCAIGSLKPNIGHLDTAAGIASLIKTTLALQHQQLPPSLHFQQPHPQIDFAHSPFFVNTRLTDWQGETRRAGVSSFGIGGTNAHVILESAPALPASSTSRSHQLLLLSAKTPTALEAAARNLAAHFQQHPDQPLADIAYTLQVGRRAFQHRRMILCDSREQALQMLSQAHPSPSLASPSLAATSPSVAFLFPGQGSQYPNMGRDLYEHEPSFRAAIDHCCSLLQPHLNLDLRTLLYPSAGHSCPPTLLSSTPLSQTALAQPTLFTLEYALAQLWLSWGIQPAAMVGHSIGEYVAACLAGVFSLEDALKLVALRGQLMQQQPTGVMLSVALSEAALQPWLNDDLSLAAHNAPELCVVSGTAAAVAQLQQQLIAQAIACRILHTSHAFHSSMMTAVQQPLIAAFQSVTLDPPKIPFISNLTGTWITATEATDPQYWANHLRQPVRFTEGITTLLQDPDRLLLEVGPGHTLSTFVKQTAKHNPEIMPEPLTSLPHANETQSDTACLLNAVGNLWLNGISLNWSAFYAHERRHRVPLPTYPFERQRYWIEPQSDSDNVIALSNSSSDHSWFYTPVWQRQSVSWDVAKLEAAIEAKYYCWLVFIDAESEQAELGHRLAAQLEQAGQAVVTVKIGNQFTQTGYRAFTVNPVQPSDYRELLEDLSRRELLPDRILYLWNLRTEADLGFYGLGYLAQAIGQHCDMTQLIVITQQAQDVTGEEFIDISQAKSLGFCQVVNQEYPNLSCRCIDIGKNDTESLVQQVLSELLLNNSPTENQFVAYRGKYRWQQQYESTCPDGQAQFSGHYVIVGDLSTGLGTIWAEQLAQLDRVKLTLIGSDLPDAHANHLSLSANITDQLQMQQMLEQAIAQQGAIRGIFYSTPMSNARSMSLIADLSHDSCDYSFQTKVQGLSILSECLQSLGSEYSPEFCLVQSSLASIVGGIGLGAYAAANRAVDALVQRQAGGKIRWYSVNWDAVQAENDADERPSFGTRLNAVALTPEQVWLATCRLLTCPAGQIVVSKTDLLTRIQQAAESMTTPESHSRPSLTSDYVAPQTEIEQQIAHIWQELLGIDRVGIHDSFFELGGHSLLAIQAIARLRDQFQVELPMQSFLFDAPTVAGIAALITSQQPPPDHLAAIAEILNEVKEVKAVSTDQARIIKSEP